MFLAMFSLSGDVNTSAALKKRTTTFVCDFVSESGVASLFSERDTTRDFMVSLSFW